MALRPMFYQDVRDACANIPKNANILTKLMTCKSYCKAVKIQYNEDLCRCVIGEMNLEPGERHTRFPPEGWNVPTQCGA